MWLAFPVKYDSLHKCCDPCYLECLPSTPKTSCKHKMPFTTVFSDCHRCKLTRKLTTSSWAQLSLFFPISISANTVTRVSISFHLYRDMLIKATWVTGVPSVRQLLYSPEDQSPDTQHASKGEKGVMGHSSSWHFGKQRSQGWLAT